MAYIPSIIPGPSSISRQAAYKTGALISGPGLDPVGWFAFPEVVFQGEISGDSSKEVKIGCRVSS